MERWKKAAFKKDKNFNEVYKMHLLQKDSCRTLCQSRLAKYLTYFPSGDEAEIESVWYTIQTAIQKATDKALGKKKHVCSRKGVQIWDEEIAAAIR